MVHVIRKPSVSRCSVSALNLISALAMCVAGDVENKIEGQSRFSVLCLQMDIIRNIGKMLKIICRRIN